MLGITFFTIDDTSAELSSEAEVVVAEPLFFESVVVLNVALEVPCV